jgi:hypothetical protein
MSYGVRKQTKRVTISNYTVLSQHFTAGLRKTTTYNDDNYAMTRTVIFRVVTTSSPVGNINILGKYNC